jgi:hypothetical protein
MMLRYLIFLNSCLLLANVSGESVKELLSVYCFDCHNEKEKKGQIRLDNLDELSTGDSQLWTNVFEQVKLGKMPPENEETFSEAEKRVVLDGIGKDFEEIVEAVVGRKRRLNRREFSAALQDLTGVSVDFGAGLPDDGKVEGFDTGAEGLKDTAETVAQMLEVTRRAVDGIRFLEPESGKRLEIDFREHKFTDFRKFIDHQYKEQGFFTKSKRLTCREGEGIFLKTEWSGDRGSSFLAIPAPADKSATIKVTLRVKAMRPMPGLPNPILWVKIGGKYLDYQSVPDDGVTLEYAVRVEDCLVEDGVVKLMLRSVVEMPYAVEGFENDDRSKPGDVPGGIGVYRPKYDRKKLRLPEEQPIPSTIVESVAIDYDHSVQWPPESWGAAIEISDSISSARALLGLWTRRAWRRPVEESELQGFLELYQKLRDDGMSFDNAMRATFQSVLMSSGFRYHASPAAEESPQFALASRLAFMLTGGPPDEELLKRASEGGLGVEKVLDEQIERLLTAPSSRDFFSPFVTQWLVMDQPVTLVMSHLQKQDFRFGRHLKSSMKEETTEYLRALFCENRPAKELITSDWTMVNDILARHYGIKGVTGAAFRKVSTKKAGDPRGGGILGHAGIQSMLTWMGDNWVIYRGAWALHHILDDPPPAPPLEVPELNPLEGGNRGKSFREVLQIHLADSRCASCHEHMDPLGFAFQNFDLSGRWRDLEFHQYSRKELDGKIEWRGKGATRPVDAKGRLPRGEEFSSYSEFKELLARDYQDDIVRGLLKRLTLYGTGRTPNVLDLKVIDEIMAKHRKKGFRLQNLAKDLLKSPVFLDHRNLTTQGK